MGTKIDYHIFVQGIQDSMVKQNIMKPIALEKFLQGLEFDIDVYEEVFELQLTQDWGRKFPGVPFSKELLQKEVARLLLSMKDVAIDEFKSQLKKNEKYKVIYNFMFRRSDFHLLCSVITSFFVTFPFFLTQFFADTDWQLYVGGFGIILNLAVLVKMYFKAKKNWEK